MPPDPGARLSQDSVSTASDPTLDDDEDATRLLTDEWIAEQDIESVPLDTLSHEQDHPRRNSSMRAITHPSRFSPLRGLLVGQCDPWNATTCHDNSLVRWQRSKAFCKQAASN